MRRLFDDIAEQKLCTDGFIIAKADHVLRFFGLYRCCGCNRYAYTLCDTCERTLRYALPLCSVCEKFSETGSPHVECGRFRPTFTKTIALFAYTKVIKSLFRVYKYHYAFQFQREIERLATQYLQVDPFLVIYKLAITRETRVVLIPVPMTARKLEDRGFSPAREIAVIIGKKLHGMFGCEVMLCTTLLRKTGDPVSQSKKNRTQRLVSLSKEFSVDEKQVQEFCATPIDLLILVDDILTTGATTTAVYEAMGARNELAEKLAKVPFVRMVFARA